MRKFVFTILFLGHFLHAADLTPKANSALNRYQKLQEKLDKMRNPPDSEGSQNYRNYVRRPYFTKEEIEMYLSPREIKKLEKLGSEMEKLEIQKRIEVMKYYREMGHVDDFKGEFKRNDTNNFDPWSLQYRLSFDSCRPFKCSKSTERARSEALRRGDKLFANHESWTHGKDTTQTSEATEPQSAEPVKGGTKHYFFEKEKGGGNYLIVKPKTKHLLVTQGGVGQLKARSLKFPISIEELDSSKSQSLDLYFNLGKEIQDDKLTSGDRLLGFQIIRTKVKFPDDEIKADNSSGPEILLSPEEITTFLEAVRENKGKSINGEAIDENQLEKIPFTISEFFPDPEKPGNFIQISHRIQLKSTEILEAEKKHSGVWIKPTKSFDQPAIPKSTSEPSKPATEPATKK